MEMKTLKTVIALIILSVAGSVQAQNERTLTDFGIQNREPKFNLYDFAKDSLQMDLPIKGGLGYTMDDAVIIDIDSTTVGSNSPIRLSAYGVELEYALAKLRILCELDLFKKDGERFYEIEQKLKQQSVEEKDGRFYDHLIMEGTCFSEPDYQALSEEYMSYQESHPTVDENFQKEHIAKRDSLQYHFETEYYFDITSFYGKKITPEPCD